MQLILKETKIPPQSYQQTAQYYTKDQDYLKQIETELKEVEAKHKLMPKEENLLSKLTREQTIEAIKSVEEEKLNALRQISAGIAQRRINPQTIPMILEGMKEQTFDRMYLDKQISEALLDKYVIIHELKEDAEFNKMVQDYAA